jgi:4-amino-4-deoxy-L-arabinose transferase-like glycosyltransferase
MSRPPAPAPAVTVAVAALVLLLFGAPLFLHLDGPDMENDEAGHSFTVDRILETGTGWLTPQAVPSGAYVEKPPLKFWLIAGAMKLGLLPDDDFGMRFFDAAFGALAFLYVYLIGCRVRGPGAGLAAGLVLFVFGPLVFGHGLRSNNMESSLVLAYCAGVFHFLGWTDGRSRAGRRGHALAAGAAFALGFLTKFVAVFFLPLVCVAGLLLDRPHRQILRARWREWLVPAALTVACVAPWFVYQTIRMGSGFWAVIVGQHVYERFTVGLDPSHLRPWSFYATQIWREWAASGAAWGVLLGLAFLVARAGPARDWRARVLLTWALVPLALISVGSSKIIHYALPFLPPLAIGTGWMLAAAVGIVRGWLGGSREAAARPLRRAAALAGFAALALAVWTLWVGPADLALPSGLTLRNQSIWRPALAAGLLLWLGGALRQGVVWSVAVLVASMLLPVHAYGATVTRIRQERHPLRTIRDCVAARAAAGAIVSPGTFAASPLVTHGYLYYLRKIGPFATGRDDEQIDAQVRARLLDPQHQSVVIMAVGDYRAWLARARAAGGAGGGPLSDRDLPLPVHVEPDFVVLLPGAYGACVAPAVAAGAEVDETLGVDAAR